MHLLLVAKTVSRIPGDPEENFAQGCLVMLEALKRWGEKERECTLEQYIVSCVAKDVRNYSRENKIIRVPARSQRAGKKIPTVGFVGCDEALLGKGEHEVVEKPQITDKLDIAILEMSVAGMTDAQIGIKLGYSTSFVQKRRRSAHERIK